MHKRYRVTLTEEERTRVHDLLSSGKAAARTLTHARILLKADQGPAGPGAGRCPFFEHLAHVLTTDGFEHPLFGQIRAQFAERPAALRQSHLVRGHFMYHYLPS